jgi:hypothetical protein
MLPIEEGLSGWRPTSRREAVYEIGDADGLLIGAPWSVLTLVSIMLRGTEAGACP